MRVQPRRRYAAPAYPTRAYLLEHPELLRWVPKRWRRNPLVLAVLGMALPLLQSHATGGEDAKGTAPAAIRVAPLFLHGDGRGSFGCVAINPPVFLSEDEARDVIREEAKKAGLNLAKTDLTLKGVSLPVTNQYEFLEDLDQSSEKKADQSERAKREKTQKGDLALDGYDAKHRVAFEFVSQKDFEAWEKTDGVVSTASDYDLKKTAEQLRHGLAQTKGDTVVGVFYEPGASVDLFGDDRESTRKMSWKERDQAAHKLGEQELRAQVRDFVAWLKAQGVL